VNSYLDQISKVKEDETYKVSLSELVSPLVESTQLKKERGGKLEMKPG
jgi:hypothetical protein